MAAAGWLAPEPTFFRLRFRTPSGSSLVGTPSSPFLVASLEFAVEGEEKRRKEEEEGRRWSPFFLYDSAHVRARIDKRATAGPRLRGLGFPLVRGCRFVKESIGKS